MKKVLVAIVLPAMVLSLSRLAAGQANPNSMDAELIQAATRGDTAAVQKLLQKGANIEAKDIGGDSALIFAAMQYNSKKIESYTQVVKLLLDKGANLEVKNTRGETALLRAAGGKDAGIVKLLLDKGANIEAEKEPGLTPLVVATLMNKAEFVSLLLDKGANTEPKWNGKTALEIAAYNRYSDIVALLQDKAAQ
jgi:ankyrin repeat protein